jgi:hypothetical protein
MHKETIVLDNDESDCSDDEDNSCNSDADGASEEAPPYASTAFSSPEDDLGVERSLDGNNTCDQPLS